jgi:WD repeat-containing protein 68
LGHSGTIKEEGANVWKAQQAKTQLIAHDKEVFDVAFARGTDIFASVGQDGSVRMFDLRSLEHSTIMYETTPSSNNPENPGLLRLSWNKQDPNYMATFQAESNTIIILDIRVPAVPVTELQGHFSPITACQWAPQSSAHILTAAEDSLALVWEIVQATKGKPITEPILCYSAEKEISNVSWNATQSEWVALTTGNRVQCLKAFS